LFREILVELARFTQESAGVVRSNYIKRNERLSALDRDQWATSNGQTVYELRWEVYTNACALASASTEVGEDDIGKAWERFAGLQTGIKQFRINSAAYRKPLPLAASVAATCQAIAGNAERQIQEQFVANYVECATNKLANLARTVRTIEAVTNAKPWFDKVEHDLSRFSSGAAEHVDKLKAAKDAVEEARRQVVQRYAAEMTREMEPKLKFPVLLNAATRLEANDLTDLKKMLARLQKDLGDPVWQSFPESEKSLDPLRKNPYGSVVNALVNPDGTLATMEIFFVPPEQDGDDWKTIRETLRYAEVSLGPTKTNLGNLTWFVKDAVSIGRAPVDAALTISFKTGVDDKTPKATWKGTNWMLPQMIRDGKVQRLDNDGIKWRLQLGLEDVQPTLKVFEVHLQRGLPKQDDWPK